jgi:hypothetical protein
MVDELRPGAVGLRLDVPLLQAGAELRLVARSEAVAVERVDEPEALPV